MITNLKSTKKSGVPIRILFMGTPDFSVPSLKAILHRTQNTSDRMQNVSSRFEIIEVVTQPDRPVGREQKLVPPPVKKLAEQHQIPILQPEKLRDSTIVEHIRDLKPDLIVVVAYGQIIPKEILKIPKYGAINVHGSVLPKYRGASPIQAAIVAGEKETGITIMLMDEQMDHGPILSRQSVAITPDETGESLFKKLAPLGADLLVKTIPGWVNGTVKPQKQNHATATYCKLLKREDGKINWHDPAEVIERKIRAYTPWPGTWTTWDGKRINILSSSVISTEVERSRPGFTFKTPAGLAIICGAGALEIFELQLEGKKHMRATDFLRGHPEIIGSTMG